MTYFTADVETMSIREFHLEIVERFSRAAHRFARELEAIPIESLAQAIPSDYCERRCPVKRAQMAVQERRDA